MSESPARYRPPVWLLALDLVLTVAVLPVVAAVVFAVIAAHRVYHPRRRPVRQTPEELGLEAERVTVRGAGDLPLSGWFVRSPGAIDTVVVSHGIGRNKGSVLPHVEMLHAAGYNVFAFDMRNHGESGEDGLLHGHAARNTMDFRRVVAHLRERPELAGGRLAFLSFSFSAWAGLLMAQFEDTAVRAIVCDSGPALDILAAFGRLLAIRRGALPLPFRGPILFTVTSAVFTSVSHWMLQPTLWPPEVSDRTLRLLFIAGGDDPVIPPAEIRRLAEDYPGSSVYTAAGASHMEPFRAQPEEYTRLVRAVLGDAFSRTAAPVEETRER